MEGLVVLLAELLVAPLAAALLMLVDVAFGVAGLASELLLRRRARASRPPSKVLRITRWILLGALAVSLLGCLVVQLFFFEPVVRTALARVEARSGIAVTFASASGNFFTGRVRLEGARIVRAGHAVSDFDVRVATLEVDVALSSALAETKRFDRVVVEGASGSFERRGKPEDDRPRMRFEVDDLALREVVLQATDRTRAQAEAVSVAIRSLRAQPFRSRWAPFDVLFRSNAELEIGGAPVRIATWVIDDGRQTTWSARAVPIALAGRWIGGPLRWITSGTLDVEVRDRWSTGESARIDMDWQLDLRDVAATVPDDASGLVASVAAPIVGFVNDRSAHLPLHFELQLDEDVFEGKASLAAAGLWDAVTTGVTRALAERAGVSASAVRELGSRGVQWFKAHLDRRRSGK